MSTGWLFTKQERITEGRRVVQHSTLHHSSQQQKPEAKRGKGKDSAPTSRATGHTVTCSKQSGTRAKPSWHHQGCLEGTASNTALSQQFWAWQEGLAKSAIAPYSIIFSSQFLSAVILCRMSCRVKRGKVIDYSLQCPSSCPKCTGSCSTPLCLQSFAGLALHRTLITKLGQMKITLKVPASVPKLLREQSMSPGVSQQEFPWVTPAIATRPLSCLSPSFVR